MIRVFKYEYQLIVTLLSLSLFSYFAIEIMLYPRVGIEIEHQENHLVINNIVKNSWAAEQDLAVEDIIEKNRWDSPLMITLIFHYMVLLKG